MKTIGDLVTFCEGFDPDVKVFGWFDGGGGFDGFFGGDGFDKSDISGGFSGSHGYKELTPLSIYLERLSQMPCTGVLQTDSRAVQPGDLFLAVRGIHQDGHDFIGEALENGAVVVIGEVAPRDEVRGATGDATGGDTGGATVGATGGETGGATVGATGGETGGATVGDTGDATGGATVDATGAEKSQIPWIQVKSARQLAGPLAHFLQDHPAKDMTVIGVTGTNGKTTVSTLIHQLLIAMGHTCTLLGTIEKVFPEGTVRSRLTTTGPAEIASDFARARDEGSAFLVMEISSHALDQHRTDGFDVDAAVFTNLTQDHLDYHGTMERYAEAKQRLFNELKEGRKAYFYHEDRYAAFMADPCRAELVFYGFDEGANRRATEVEMTLSGARFELDGVMFSTRLVGRHNVANVLAALSVVMDVCVDGHGVKDSSEGVEDYSEDVKDSSEGVEDYSEDVKDSSEDFKTPAAYIRTASERNSITNTKATAGTNAENRAYHNFLANLQKVLSEIPGPEGRLERVNGGGATNAKNTAHAAPTPPSQITPHSAKKETSSPLVFVDYAHTPDALEHVCKTLKELMPPSRHLHVVFGCGGDRDRGKRPLMGRTAEKHADVITLTSDNPRSEDPLAIIGDILAGCKHPERVHCEPDRRKAIRQTILQSTDAEVILIAGKGHETTQEIQGVRMSLDDRIEAAKAIRERGNESGLEGALRGTKQVAKQDSKQVAKQDSKQEVLGNAKQEAFEGTKQVAKQDSKQRQGFKQLKEQDSPTTSYREVV